MELAKIIENIRVNTGIERFNYELNDWKVGFGYFCQIANVMLESKGVHFDAKTCKKEVEILVKWSYTLDKGVDFKKGILFKGHTGRGKTFLFRVFAEFLKIDNIKFVQNGKTILMTPRIVNTRQISGEYQDPISGGYKVIQKYSNMNCLVIDDIGAEQSESSNYGNKVNVVAEIIDKREEMNMLTFGTTNINRFKDAGYDDRIVSRVNALFNAVSINHDKDFRKQKNRSNEN